MLYFWIAPLPTYYREKTLTIIEGKLLNYILIVISNYKKYYFLYIDSGGTISLISKSYMSNLKSFALSITIGEPHVIA